MTSSRPRPAQDQAGGADTGSLADAGGSGAVGPLAPDLPVHEIRAFNRFYTNLIGALDYSRQLYAPFTLTEARVLYELAHSPRTDAADLRTELALDAGYLSRLLGRFEKDELVERGPSPHDPRRQSVTLTGRGHSTAELLDERSQRSVGGMLAAVPAPDRSRLTAAMRTIRDILSEDRSSPRPEDVRLRAPGPGDLSWIAQRNAALYAAEYGWDADYEALVIRIVADFAERHDPDRERVWIAELGERPVGCVMCVRDDHDGDDGGHGGDDGRGQDGAGDHGHGRGDDDGQTTAPDTSPQPPATHRTARLRLLLVEPEARGLGIGDRLVSACVDFARDAGYDDMVLWTNDVLHAARSIYQRHGFTLTAEQRHHSFGADLVGQDWHLPLRAPAQGTPAAQGAAVGETSGTRRSGAGG